MQFFFFDSQYSHGFLQRFQVHYYHVTPSLIFPHRVSLFFVPFVVCLHFFLGEGFVTFSFRYMKDVIGFVITKSSLLFSSKLKFFFSEATSFRNKLNLTNFWFIVKKLFQWSYNRMIVYYWFIVRKLFRMTFCP